jgi:hypothetical protein
MIARCPAAYERRYINGEIIPPGIEAIKGTGVHGGAAVNFKQKIETHRDLPPGQIIDAAVASFEGASRAGFTLTDEESSVGPSRILGQAKDHVVTLARLLSTFVHEYQPTFVEQSVRLELPGASHDLLGVLDLADDQKRVTDFKTAAKAKSQAEVDSSIQLTYYAAAHRILTGTLPDIVQFEILVKKREPERVTIRSRRDARDFAALANRINAVLAQIQSGIFPPASPGSWWCSRKWCGFHATCPFVNHSPPEIHDLKLPARRTIDGAALPEPIDESPALDLAALDLSRIPIKPDKRLMPAKNPRDRLWAANPHCHWCGRKIAKKFAMLDHIVPLAKGGRNEEGNYCLACRECHGKRDVTGVNPEFAATAAGAETR